MPEYAYFQLSDEERTEILNLRKEKGFPLHSPPHPFQFSGTFAITVSTYQHAHIIDTPQRRTDFEARLLRSFIESGAAVSAWAVLTNHSHIMVGVQSLNVVSEILQHLHGTTSREWNLEEGFSGKRKVWYKFYDRMIRNDKHYSKALNYIHYNPVKHQYVRDPFNWPWTSLYLYFEDKGREWLREQWRPYPPDDRTAGEFQE